MIGVLSLVHGELTAAFISEKGFFVILIIAFAAFLTWGIAGKKYLPLVLYVILYISGFYIMYREESRHKLLEAVEVKERVSVEGRVCDIIDSDYGMEIIIKVTKGWNIPIKDFKCRVYIDRGLWGSSGADYGNSVKIEGTKREFSEPLNPGAFDEKTYSYGLDIIFKVNGESIEIVDKTINELQSISSYIRGRMTEILKIICSDKEAGVFMAMLYGEKGQLDDDLKEMYGYGGISHILAISGLHISIIGMGVYSAIRHFMAQRWAGVISTLFMIMYGIMSGGSVSAIRAIIMFFVNLLGKLTGNIYDIKNSICIAAFILLVQNPYYLYNMSFLLSFGAVVSIGFILPYVTEFVQAEKSIIKSFISGITVNIANGPVVANGFYQMPIYGVFLNLLVIPLMGIAVLSGIAGIVAGIFSGGAGKIFIFPGVAVLKIYEWLCTMVSSLPLAVVVTGHFELKDMVIYYGIVILSTALMWIWDNREYKWLRDKVRGYIGISRKKGKLFRYMFGGIVCIILHVYIYTTYPQRGIMTFLHVGQGDSAILSVKDMVCIFDGGSTSIKNTGKYVILPYLKYSGIKKIDYIILSHSDEDHINGIYEVLLDKAVTVDNVVLPMGDEGFGSIEGVCKEKGINVIRADSTMSIKAGETEIDFINPINKYVGVSNDVNNNSLAAVINVYGKKIGMMGDMGEDTEILIAEEYEKGNMKIIQNLHVLKVPHHGSKYSSSYKVLEIYNPVLSVISCGSNNIYGHPHSEALSRLKEKSSDVCITYETGAVTLYLDNNEGVAYDYFTGNN